MLEKILIVPDLHAPYHNRRAWDLLLKVGRAFKPWSVVVIGDFADCYAVSFHDKDPKRMRHLDLELIEVRSCLDDVDALGAKEKLFLLGNHEYRLDRYISTKAPELDGTVSVDTLLQLRDRGWETVPYKDHTNIGKLHLTHDVGSAGRNAIFKSLEAFQHSVVSGHTHRLQYIVEGNALGEAMVAASFGWLGDVSRVDYMHKIQALRNWALGFGIGYYNPQTQYVYLVPVPIVNYTCVVEGVLYEG
jgi:predicted phosphodiesterase